jgi:putative transposase
VKVVQAYRFALNPTPAQERMLRRMRALHGSPGTGVLLKCQERYAAERKWYSAIDLSKLWNAEKKADPGLAWWSENSKCTYEQAFRDGVAHRPALVCIVHRRGAA